MKRKLPDPPRAFEHKVPLTPGNLLARANKYSLNPIVSALEDDQELSPEGVIRRAGSYAIMPVLLMLRAFCDTEEWYRLLGQNWSSCDGIGLHWKALSHLLRSTTPSDIDHMMTSEERALRDSLPRFITAWRGCYPYNKHGLSYSMRHDIAAAFPFFNRYRGKGQPLLVTARVARTEAVVKLDRNEAEVIAINPCIVEERDLRKPDCN